MNVDGSILSSWYHQDASTENELIQQLQSTDLTNTAIYIGGDGSVSTYF